jgi:hypothetical protein
MIELTQLHNGQPIDDRVEHQLDLHITECGKQIQKAIAEGDRPAAIRWQEAMYEAIRSRSPAHKARLESEIQARIENPENCYFFESGSLALFKRTEVAA